MRVLLDECVPKRLAHGLEGHEVRTVAQQGWSGWRNGELLRSAAAEFDVLLTVDQGLPFQQNLALFDIAVVAIAAASNDLEALRPFLPAARRAIEVARPGSFTLVEGAPPDR